MIQFVTWLKKPYPFPVFFDKKIMVSGYFGVFVALFLAIFKPFDFNSLEEKTSVFALVYGFIAFVLIFINLYLPRIIPFFKNENQWTIGKVLFFIFFVLFQIAIINWYFSLKAFKMLALSEHSLLFFIGSTLTIAFFPMVFFLYFSERKMTRENTSVANKISKIQRVQNSIELEHQVQIAGDNKNEVLALDLQNLLFISFEKNYASFFMKKENTIETKLIRISLAKIEKQLESYSYIVRCHKSYLVNTRQVETILGNARNYQLSIKNPEEADFLIPVSRSFPKELLFSLIQ